MRARTNVPAQQLRRLFKLFVLDSQIRQFQQRVGKLRIGLQSSLKKSFRPGVISLPLFDKAHVKKARCIARIVL